MLQIHKNVLSVEKIVRTILASNKEESSSFYNKYLQIEQIARRDLKNLLIYRFKNENNAQFIVRSKNNHIYMAYKSDEKDITISPENTVEENRLLCEELDLEIRRKRLYFSPEPDKEFVNDILSANVGDIFSYNNKCAFVCVCNDSNEKQFRYAFSGDIKNITMDAFEQSEIFRVDNDNSSDLKYMYSLAYDAESLSVTRRKYDY